MANHPGPCRGKWELNLQWSKVELNGDLLDNSNSTPIDRFHRYLAFVCLYLEPSDRTHAIYYPMPFIAALTSTSR